MITQLQLINIIINKCSSDTRHGECRMLRFKIIFYRIMGPCNLNVGYRGSVRTFFNPLLTSQCNCSATVLTYFQQNADNYSSSLSSHSVNQSLSFCASNWAAGNKAHSICQFHTASICPPTYLYQYVTWHLL